MNTHIRHEGSLSVLEILDGESDKQIVDFPTSNIADIHTDYHGPSPYHLNYCGLENCSPGFRFGPFIRRSYLLHIVISGKGTYQAGSRTYKISAGEMFLIYPGVSTTYTADREDPWSYGWIGFSGYQAEYILSQAGFSNNSHVLRLQDTEPLTECIRQMLETHQITLANELVRDSLLLQFLSLILKQCAASRSRPVHTGSAYASVTMKYLTDHYMDRIRIADIAEYIGVDRSHLSKCFHTEYGMSPQEYLLRLRMRKAAQLLEDTGESISGIARQCGYEDALAFTKIFRKHYGISPSAFREKQESKKKLP